MEKSSLPGLQKRLATGLVALALAGTARVAAAYTAGSPEVRQMLAQAIGFLESDDANDTRIGAQALVGLVLLKHGDDARHPKIIEGVKSIRKAVSSHRDPRKLNLDIYSTALAIVFLCTLDPAEHGPEIEALLEYLESVQKPHGGWGYLSGGNAPYGDTSMTQNAVLSLWEATQAGFRVPIETTENVAMWLVKTQDPSGGFGYQGRVSSDFTLVNQSEIRHSLTAAGLGSLYICADLLGLDTAQRKESELPPALKEIEQQKAARRETRIDARLVHAAQARGNQWIQANYRIDPQRYPCYYLYTLERYWTFRNAAEGRSEGSPPWYNDGVEHLRRVQKANGAWSGECGDTASTAFAALFLMRSTKETLERVRRSYGEGTLILGRGLPSHTAGVTVYGGKVVAKLELESLDQMLAALDDAKSPDSTEALDALAELPSSEAGPLISKYAKKLQQLVGDKSPEARLAAVQALGKDRNLDHVPRLIYALTDPDRAVMIEARDALRRISRRFQGFGLPDNPTEAELEAAIKKWEAWYRAIRPDAEFED